MAVKFIIDSGCDITDAVAKELGVYHLPLKIIFGEEEFEDTVNLSHREFYEKLVECDTLPTTCQVPPAAFEEAYKAVIEAGDTAVVITVSGKLSGTYQSAMIALEGYEDKVIVVDSENAAIGERILLERGLELCAQGLSAKEIADILNEEKKHIRVLGLLETLLYLKMGGRVSSTVAFAAGVLSIKPVVSVENGEVVMAGKARGSKQANNLLRELVIKCGGIDTNKPFCLAYSGLSDEMLRKYIEDNIDLIDGYEGEIPVATIGCAIGTHVGPGVIAIAFFDKTAQ